jgi:hypothetical protein
MINNNMINITPGDGFPKMYDFIGDNVTKGLNPFALIIFTVIILLYYVLFSYLGVNIASTSSGGITPSRSVGLQVIEIIMWGMFIFLVLINGIQYFLNIDIKTGIKNFFTPVPEVDIAITTPALSKETDEVGMQPQVFHIPDNKYTYHQAKALCNAHGADLANYEQIEQAYENGAEWCGYGWSANQMALYPTQKDTWDELQKVEGHKHDCGRPGINGGYIRNRNVKFGANCFGYKPAITPSEQIKLDGDESPIPLTKRERDFNKMVKEYKNKLSDIAVSPFNYDIWSEN